MALHRRPLCHRSGLPRENRGTSSDSTHSKRKAPAISFLDKRISTPGVLHLFHRISQAICSCLGCNAGGCQSLCVKAFTPLWSCSLVRGDSTVWEHLVHSFERAGDRVKEEGGWKDQDSLLVHVLPNLAIELVDVPLRIRMQLGPLAFPRPQASGWHSSETYVPHPGAKPCPSMGRSPRRAHRLSAAARTDPARFRSSAPLSHTSFQTSRGSRSRSDHLLDVLLRRVLRSCIRGLVQTC